MYSSIQTKNILVEQSFKVFLSEIMLLFQNCILSVTTVHWAKRHQ